MYFTARANRRLLAAITALLLAAAALTGCASDAVGDTATTTAALALDPDNPGLIAGEEKITQDPFNYLTEDLTDYVTLGNYRGLVATRGSAVVTEDELEAMLVDLREYYAEPTPITDRAAAAGDTCNFDFSGYIDGEKFDGGTATGQSITLEGNGGYIEGFVTAIIGKKPGESFDIETTFPEDYHQATLRGKKAVFKCTLNFIEGELIIPELTDAFAKEVSGLETVAELRADLRARMEADRKAQVDNQLYSDLWSQVVTNATIHKYPEQKVTFIYQQLVQEYGSYAAMSYGVTYEEYIAMAGVTDAQVRQMARDQVKDDLIFYSLVKAEQIAVDDAEYEQRLPEFAAAMDMSIDALNEQYGKELIRDGMVWNKTQDLIVTWANLTEAE